MVKILENPIKMDDLGGKPPIFGNPHVKVLRLRNEISSPLASPQRCLCVRQESSRQASPKKSRQKTTSAETRDLLKSRHKVFVGKNYECVCEKHLKSKYILWLKPQINKQFNSISKCRVSFKAKLQMPSMKAFK